MNQTKNERRKVMSKKTTEKVLSLNLKSAATSTSTYYNVPLDLLEVEDGWNPRVSFLEIAELAKSIEANGVKIPLTVRKGTGDKADKLLIVNGERRYRACKMLAARGVVVDIPVVLTKASDENERLIEALVSNDGKPLSFAEEAEAIRRLIEGGMKSVDVATSLGRNPSYITQRMQFATKAAPEVKEAVKRGQLSKQAAVDVVKAAADEDEQKELLQKEVAASKLDNDGKARRDKASNSEARARVQDKRAEKAAAKSGGAKVEKPVKTASASDIAAEIVKMEEFLNSNKADMNVENVEWIKGVVAGMRWTIGRGGNPSRGLGTIQKMLDAVKEDKAEAEAKAKRDNRKTVMEKKTLTGGKDDEAKK